jgi:hypothetical protein
MAGVAHCLAGHCRAAAGAQQLPLFRELQRLEAKFVPGRTIFEPEPAK